MMDTMATLVRRGSQFAQKQTEVEIPNWAVAVIVILAITFSISLTLVDYTYGNLIPTLIMVEDPKATLYDPLETEDPLLDLDNNKKTGQATEPELFVKPKPVTFSFRTTLTHLRARAGRRSRFRGIASFFVSAVVISHITRAISFIGILPGSPIVAPVLASAIAAHFPLLWTHIVISEPTAKSWFKRFAPLRTWKKIAGPTAIFMLVRQVAILVPAMLALRINTEGVNAPHDLAKMACRDQMMLVLKGLGVSVLSFVLWIVLVIPAKVSLTRVQSSLLADEYEPIVPFDRSFGGKVIPAIVGGSGVLGMKDAWKTFDRNSRVRLLKAYIKVAAIEIALTLLFSGAAIATAVLAVGPENLKKLLESIKTGDDHTKVTHV
ncbi:hypothetical protein B7463_g9310, partial [Scytalidium lignicola]